jgi:hypothetical protein
MCAFTDGGTDFTFRQLSAMTYEHSDHPPVLSVMRPLDSSLKQSAGQLSGTQ